MQEYIKLIKQKRILLVHLVSMGDCLYVTSIARQIKQDNPGSHLTWAISSRCSEIIQNNPFVDEIWEISSETFSDYYGPVWEATKKEAINRKKNGIYDEIFFTQIWPDNISNFDGTIRSSTFRGYPNPITGSIAPIIFLTEKEIENVRNFAAKYNLSAFHKVILFESSPGSGQSPINIDFALAMSKRIVDNYNDAIVIITSHQKITTGHERIIDGSLLTFRENAELSKYCNLLIGGSSGITWLLTSTWAKKIPTIQILKQKTSVFEFASIRYDLGYWNESIDHIVEITRFEDEYIFGCIQMVLEKGIEKARDKYNVILKPNRNALFWLIKMLLYAKKYKQIFNVTKNYYDRNGDFLIIIVCPFAITKALISYIFDIFIRIKKTFIII